MSERTVSASRDIPFAMRMRIGLPYPIRNTVVEFEPERRLAWRHVARHRWRYELEPVEGDTRVTETFAPTTSPVPWVYAPLGFLTAHERNIPATLQRLERLAVAEADRLGPDLPNQ